MHAFAESRHKATSRCVRFRFADDTNTKRLAAAKEGNEARRNQCNDPRGSRTTAAKFPKQQPARQISRNAVYRGEDFSCPAIISRKRRVSMLNRSGIKSPQEPHRSKSARELIRSLEVRTAHRWHLDRATLKRAKARSPKTIAF